MMLTLRRWRGMPDLPAAAVAPAGGKLLGSPLRPPTGQTESLNSAFLGAGGNFRW
jgi:hypothetical protein